MKVRKLLRKFRIRTWRGWPERAYRRERFRQRLQAVQKHLAECLDAAPPGPIRIISLCAGDGRDVIGVLETHHRRSDVTAVLVERDARSVELGAALLRTAGLEGSIRFICGDATDYETFRELDAAEIVVICGVWGHVPPEDGGQLVRALASLCKPAATVVWTKGIANGTARFEAIRSLHVAPTWKELLTTVRPERKFAVATHQYCGPVVERPLAGRIFHFRRAAGR